MKNALEKTELIFKEFWENDSDRLEEDVAEGMDQHAKDAIQEMIKAYYTEHNRILVQGGSMISIGEFALKFIKETFPIKST